MKLVNRSAIALIPTPAMLAWVNRVDPEDKITLAEAQIDPMLFLASDIQDEEELKEFLEDNFDQLFEYALNEWYTDRSIWPSRTYQNFTEYFTPKLFTMLADIDDDLPLERDEFVAEAYDDEDEEEEEK